MAIQSNFPALRPLLDLNFAGSRTVDPRITFSRSGTGNIASYFNEKGVMQFAPANTPRIDFDPATLECKGLLIEEQRTNLLTYSDQFNNSAFVKTGTSITTNTIVSPDGSITADKLVEDTTTDEHYLRSTPVSCSAGTYTASVYWHSSSERNLYLRVVHTGETTSTSQVTFNRSSLTLGAVFGNAISASAQNVGDGWWRISLVFQITATRNVQFGVQCSITIPVSSASYTGDGVSGIHIWGAQLEQGSFPTSYIPTTSAQVTRAADSVSMQSNNFLNWYRQEEGTFLCNYVLGDDNTSVGVLRVTDAVNNEISMRYSSSQYTQATITTSGAIQANLALSGFSTKGSYNRAISYSNNYFQQSINGELPSAADTSCTIPTVSQLIIGREDNINFLNGHIKRIAYYPKRVTDQQLQALTA